MGSTVYTSLLKGFDFEIVHDIFGTLSLLGKTLLAKAVANQTAATFLRVVGSELIQKYLVREEITKSNVF